MGNFMVLNLFLALLLNSFNSEELKTRKEVPNPCTATARMPIYVILCFFLLHRFIIFCRHTVYVDQNRTFYVTH
jgi:hypothetical protein